LPIPSSPTAATASPTSGATPLTVQFDGSGSSDPDSGDTLSYAWDLDGDGSYDDSTAQKPSYTYDQAGSYQVDLKVSDGREGSDALDEKLTITAGDTPPVANIATPAAGTTWKVGDIISFSGSASDAQDGTLPASGLSWELIMHHCPSNCHTHPIQTFPGVDSGTFAAPDHEYPSYLELRLTATDSGGLTDTKSMRLDPKTVVLTFESDPSALNLVVGSSSATAPFSRTVIIGSNNSISASSPQTLGGKTYNFVSWSDGGAQTHNITAPATATTYTARFSESSTYGLKESTKSDRSGAADLQGITASGNIYVFTSPEAGVKQVSFYLDDPNMTGTPRQVENTGPWDFAGGTTSTANPLDTTKLSNGSHTITAKVSPTDGTAAKTVSSSFTVRN